MKNEKEIIDSAISLAENGKTELHSLLVNGTKEFYVKMNKMFEHPKDKALLIELMDQAFRCDSNARIVDQICFY